MYRAVVAAVAALTCSAPVLRALPETITQAREHAEKGVQCAQAGDLNCAESELRRAVTLAPDDAAYLTSLGGILGMKQQFDAANVFFERAVRSDPENAAARRNLAANEWRLGQLKSAQVNLERLLRSQPEDKVATLLLGMVSENEHDYPRAAKLLSAVPDLVQQRPESMAALANAYYHTGRRDQARSLLESLAGTTVPPEGIFAAAGVAAQSEDYGVAEKLFNSIRSRYPDTASIEYNIALIQFNTQRVPESEKTLLPLVDAGRANAEIYNLLGRCYQKDNKQADAARMFQKGIERQPAEESNYRDLVALLMERNRLAAALALASKTTEVFPRSASAYLDLASLEMQTHAFTDAVRSYARAVELDAGSLDAQVGLASAKWAAGMRSEAQRRFEALLKQHPRDAGVYQSYGTALATDAADDRLLERAAYLLQKAIQLDGSHAEAHYQLGQLNLKRSTDSTASGSLGRAVEELETAARLGLNDSRVHFALARAYRRLGREDYAAKEMSLYQQIKATETNPNPAQTAAAQSR